MSTKAVVRLEARWQDGRLAIDVHNTSSAELTVVTHPRYLVIELKDERGQYVRGTQTGVGMPTRKDFADVAARSSVPNAFELDVTNDGGSVTIGPWAFTHVVPKTEVRVTYKSDPVVPNLPSSKRRTFFRGPVEANLLTLDADATGT